MTQRTFPLSGAALRGFTSMIVGIIAAAVGGALGIPKEPVRLSAVRRK